MNLFVCTMAQMSGGGPSARLALPLYHAAQRAEKCGGGGKDEQALPHYLQKARRRPRAQPGPQLMRRLQREKGRWALALAEESGSPQQAAGAGDGAGGRGQALFSARCTDRTKRKFWRAARAGTTSGRSRRRCAGAGRCARIGSRMG